MTRRLTRRPASRPVGPALRRMLLGLGLAGAGLLLIWEDRTLVPRPGLGSVTTPVRVPLDGPLPLDMARTAAVRVSGDRANLTLGPLAQTDGDVLRGQGTHRERNPLHVQTGRTGGDVRATLTMNVQALDRDQGIGVGPEPFQHDIAVKVTPRIPLTLSTTTSGGTQALDLSTLRLRSLNVRSNTGPLDVTLPARPSGPLTLSSLTGDIRVTAARASAPEVLTITNRTGDLTLNLRSAAMGGLSVNTTSGEVRLTLPARTGRGSVQTAMSDMTVTATPGTTGRLDLRTVTGDVTVRVPARLRVRVRFPERETITLPAGADEGQEPQLDLFVDCPARNFTLETLPDSSPPTGASP